MTYSSNESMYRFFFIFVEHTDIEVLVVFGTVSELVMTFIVKFAWPDSICVLVFLLELVFLRMCKYHIYNTKIVQMHVYLGVLYWNAFVQVLYFCSRHVFN